MKRKTIKKRQMKSATYFMNGEKSKYAKKIALQKRGNFSSESPFSLSDSGKLSLQEFNKIRFVN